MLSLSQLPEHIGLIATTPQPAALMAGSIRSARVSASLRSCVTIRPPCLLPSAVQPFGEPALLFKGFGLCCELAVKEAASHRNQY